MNYPFFDKIPKDLVQVLDPTSKHPYLRLDFVPPVLVRRNFGRLNFAKLDEHGMEGERTVISVAETENWSYDDLRQFILKNIING